MSFEEILQTISEYWALFVASGAYVIVATYGTVIIRQLFVKATTSGIVNKFITTISTVINYIKGKVDLIFNRVQSLQVEVANIENTVNDINAKIEAFMEAILNAPGQEEVLNSFNAILSEQPQVEVQPVIIEEVVEEEVIEEPKEKPKKKKKVKKQKTKEVNNYVEELY